MAKKKPPVEQVIEVLGGASKVAAALKLKSASVVLNWRARGQVPAERVLEVEKLSGISRHELRPDIFGKAVPAQGEAA